VKHYRFHREALDEYEDAIAYYERARPGLGESFILEVDRTIALTLEFPEIGAPVADTPPELGIRRRLVQRFSVEIDYQVSGDSIVVLAVFHSKRRPGYWKNRLG
jgi:plasmid stabilization system protein ParE